MPGINEKLERFTSTIMAEASAEVNATKQEFAEIRKKTLKRTELEAKAAANSYFESEKSRIQAEAGRQISLHLLENKRTLALKREELAQDVFSQVRERIAAFTQKPEYLEHLKVLLGDVLNKLGSCQTLNVYLRPEDFSAGAELNAAAGGAEVNFLKGSFVMGGLIVECPEKHLRFDCTFDTAEAELDGHFAELFGLSLSDD